jgi:hypothetical protein
MAAGRALGGRELFVSFTRASTADQPIENATMLAEEMHGWLRDIEGYHGFVMLSQEGTSIGLTFWDSRDIAEHHLAVRREFIERMTGVVGVQVEEMTGFDVAFADLSLPADGPLRPPAP